jgi:hypothetical protein
MTVNIWCCLSYCNWILKQFFFDVLNSWFVQSFSVFKLNLFLFLRSRHHLELHLLHLLNLLDLLGLLKMIVNLWILVHNFGLRSNDCPRIVYLIIFHCNDDLLRRLRWSFLSLVVWTDMTLYLICWYLRIRYFALPF